MQARDYQQKLRDDVMSAWNAGSRHVLMVAPTGAGKTFIKSLIIKTAGVPTCCIAHRQELVGQISFALAQFGIFHRIVAPPTVQSFCVRLQQRKLGRSFISGAADVGVCGVDTLLRRADALRQWLNRCELWDIDEAHHVLPGNKWGKAVELFPRARGLGVTATPIRADRKGLDGVFDTMIVGPSMRELIAAGHLADYRIFAPPTSIDTNALVTGSTGDYTPKSMTKAVEDSTITGDVVDHYLRIAPGKLGITFCVNVAMAGQVAREFQRRGVAAEAVSAKTPDDLRQSLLERFAAGEIKQLVNVDLFGEGMDVPAVEVVSMARPTQSYGLFVQQFGRGLRTAPGKTHGILIDHVGNVARHGLPDAPRAWSLSVETRRARQAVDEDVMPVTTCHECFRVFEAVTKTCPYCGAVKPITDRTLPQHVDGDLIELDPATLAALRGEVDRIDGEPRVPNGLDPVAVRALTRRWGERQDAQRVLRDAIARWAGIHKHGHGREDSEIYRRFFHRFGTDVMTAQTLNTSDATALAERIEGDMT